MENVEAPFRLGPWVVDLERGRIDGPGGEAKLEPKVADLLAELVKAEGQVVSRDDLFALLWPGVTVGDDTLTRAVFKLRRSLGDDPKDPRFVETVPKRGYRLMMDPVPLRAERVVRRRVWLLPALAAAVLAAIAALFIFLPAPGESPAAAMDVERAKDRYMRFTRADNEAAIDLYQRALEQETPDPSAEAGLAAALVQRVVRWPEALGSATSGTDSLSGALAAGLTTTPEAQATLERARSLAERAVRRAPGDAAAWRVLGLVLSAQGETEKAFEAYGEALAREPGEWGALINLAELHKMNGRDDEAYETLTAAYEAMTKAYPGAPQRIGLWRAPAGVLIAETDLAAGRLDDAEGWYRRVLRDEPFDRAATAGLARLLGETGRPGEARRLCEDFEARTGEALPCPA